jgi:hypothetical protein
MSSSLLGVLEQFKILDASSTVMTPLILAAASFDIFELFAISKHNKKGRKRDDRI